MERGSKSARSTPLLGLAFLISAMTAGSPRSSLARSAPTKSRTSWRSRAARSSSAIERVARAVAISACLVATMRSRISLIGFRSQGSGDRTQHEGLSGASASGGRTELLRRLHELIELSFRATAADRLARLLDALGYRRSHVRRVERHSGIEDHDLARRALDAGERLEHHLLRFQGVRHLEAAVADHAHAEILGMDLVLAHLAVLELADHGRGAERNLVHAVLAVHHQHVLA